MQQTVRHRLDQAPPRRRQTLRRRAHQPHAEPHAFRPEVFAHAQGHPQHHAACGQRVGRHPIDETAQFVAQRRRFEFFADVLQAIVQARFRIGIIGPDHGHGVACTQRDADDIAGRQLNARGHTIGIGLVQRDRHHDINETGLADGRSHTANRTQEKMGLRSLEFPRDGNQRQVTKFDLILSQIRTHCPKLYNFKFRLHDQTSPRKSAAGR